MRPTSRFVLPFLLALALAGPGPTATALAQSAPPVQAGVPHQGPVGRKQSVAEMMQLQSRTPARQMERDQEEKAEKPDRRNLPLNPESPLASAMIEGRGAEPARLSPGRTAGTFGAQTVPLAFTAATLSGINPTLAFPPDCMGAVGPSQFVVFVNGRLVTFNKTTGLADGHLNVDPDVFFSSVIDGSFTSDPRVRYDRLTGRWFLIIINVNTPNRILLAVSDGLNAGAILPQTVFTFFYIDIAATPPAISNTCFADYPTLGLDANALYIGVNNFCGSPSQTFNGCDGYVVRKSSILGAGPLVVTVFRGIVASAAGVGPYTPQGVDNFDPAATEGYFIGVDNATFGTLMFRRVLDPGGTPTISGNLSITVPATSFPATVPHLGNTGGSAGNLSALDDRLYAAHVRNGRLWTAHNIRVNNTGAAAGTQTRDAARWYELNVPTGSGTPTVLQSGTVFTATGNNLNTERQYWIPSIMVSGQGHAAMGTAIAGTNERANAAVAGRWAGDPAGTMQAPEVISGSATAYNPPGDPGEPGFGRRWGDYTYTSLDPVDDMTMWTVSMFCNASNSYGVRVAKLLSPPPATPAVIADVTAGVAAAPVALTATVVNGSGFYDPGPNLPGVVPFSHLSATILNTGVTGTPPSVVSATYVNPTTVNLVLDATSATASIGSERYTVRITNPDGQSAEAAVLRVLPGVPVATLAASVGLPEGDADTTAFGFTVNLSSPALADVVVRYETSDGTATLADLDYVAVSDSITIPAGQSTGAIVLVGNGDTKHEADEAFALTLTSVTNANLGATVLANAVIENDDAAPLVSIDDLALPEGDADTTAFGFTATLSAPSGLPVTLQWDAADGTATLADLDYVAASGPLTFAPGDTELPVIVAANGDLAAESDETFLVHLSSLAGATFADSVGTGTILDDDTLPTISIADTAGVETHAGTTTLTFRVHLSEIAAGDVTASWTTADGSATEASGDYVSGAGLVTVPAGDLAATVEVTVNGDICGEPDETLLVQLSAASGATFADSVGAGTILNDDDATPPVVTVTSPNGGELLVVGGSANVTWTATDDIGVTAVDVLLSRDGGATYGETLASGVPNSGTFGWTITGPGTTPGQAFVRVIAHDAGCNAGVDSSDTGFQVSDPATAAPGGAAVTAFALGRLMPNPTTGATQVEFDLPREANVRVVVIDTQGREVAILASGSYSAGRHLARWDGRGTRGAAPVGVYFVRYSAGGKSFTRRLALVR